MAFVDGENGENFMTEIFKFPQYSRSDTLKQVKDLNKLVMDDYEKKYKEALERMKSWVKGEHPECFCDAQKAAEFIFPELAESEDEKIKREIVAYINELADLKNEKIPTKWLTWLEKQKPSWSEKDKNLLNRLIGVLDGTNEEDYHEAWEETFLPWLKSIKERIQSQPKQSEQSTDKINTKFNAGDWIVDDKTPNDVFCVIEVLEEIYKVIDIDGDDYHIPHCKADKKFHIWTIQDAKDGDVLASKDGNDILIFRNLDTHISFSSYYNTRGKGEIGWSNNYFIPATKEQRELLFQKMKGAGYGWDADKKELVEIISKKLDVDEVIEWLRENVPMCWEVPCSTNRIIDKFKNDFGL